jgi:hypothetical protein
MGARCQAKVKNTAPSRALPSKTSRSGSARAALPISVPVLLARASRTYRYRLYLNLSAAHAGLGGEVAEREAALRRRIRRRVG